MFELTVDREFCAAHALRFPTFVEPLHGHNFRVSVVVAGETLDPSGMLMDFHALERLVDEILRPFHNANLNDLPPFDRLSPSAERIAQVLGDRIVDGLCGVAAGSGGVNVRAVRVTEAPGCTAAYFPPSAGTSSRRPQL